MSRVALVHDWLTGMRGGEKVLDAICELYPQAPLYTLVRVRGSVSARIEDRRITTSIAQWLPAAGRAYRHYLPVFPAAVEMWDLDGYDLVISTSHCAAKSVVRAGRALHVCYCHSPMRYAWDQFSAYFGPDRVGTVSHRLLRPVMAGLARWDRETAGRVDRFVANSRYVAARIRRYYNRGSTVVYPPVDTVFYRPSDDPSPSDSGFLIVSALVAYKRLDLAIQACRRVGAPLTIVGRGPELNRLQRLAGPDVTFRGWLPDEDIRALYQRATAVLLPGVEDFGLVPVEAQACGAPVVALGRGGACESVLHGQTGILVDDDSVDAFAQGLRDLQSLDVDRAALRRHAETFSRERFLREFREIAEGAAREDAASRHDRQASDPTQVQPAAREDAARGDAASRHDRHASDPTQVQPAAREDAASRHERHASDPTQVQPAARGDAASRHDRHASDPTQAQPAAREDVASRHDHQASDPTQVQPAARGDAASRHDRQASDPTQAQPAAREDDQ